MKALNVPGGEDLKRYAVLKSIDGSWLELLNPSGHTTCLLWRQHAPISDSKQVDVYLTWTGTGPFV